MNVVFRADGLPLASRVDYWREIISNVFMPLDLRGEVGPKTPAELRTTEIGPIRFTESVTGPGSSFRTGRTPRFIRSSDPDVCLVGVSVPKAMIPLRDRELGELTDELPAPEAARLGTAGRPGPPPRHPDAR
jgi:hypothetical protein